MEIKLKSVKNVRDLGGQYPGGPSIRTGMLLRGARLSGLTKKDATFLRKTYGDVTIIDLRTAQEREGRPDKTYDFDIRLMPIFDLEQPGISHGKGNIAEILASLPTMDALYSMMLHDEYLDNLRAVLRFIMTCETPVYFHCTEGKDRTGLVGAILLLSLGVSREEIIKDYLVTNKTNERKAQNIARLIYIYKRDRAIAEKIHDLFIAKLEYLQVLFDVIDNEYGSPERFFTIGLRIDDVLPSFRKRMLQ
ncbi:MAG: tyrosine-protein phosphatase [Clostridia bacterium]|nr:tyrosine-protein phosphatase [Clostridia bacterium]